MGFADRVDADNLYAPLPLFANLDTGGDLFALDTPTPSPRPVSIAAPVSSFEAMQEKVRRTGLAGQTAEEKLAYLEMLRRKPDSQDEPDTAPCPAAPPLPASSGLPEFRNGQRTLTYAGVGSRETPADVLELMGRLAGLLESKGYLLQTGDATGADAAFASGCSRKVIFTAKDANEATLAIAQEIHPAPWLLPPYVRRLIARNTFQVFGRNLDTPVDFLICWTQDGCSSHTARTRETGGTGQAIALASLKGIPVINMRTADWRDRLKDALAKSSGK